MPLELTGLMFGDDLEALLALQDVLLQAVEGARGGEIDHEYKELRKVLMDDDTYKEVVPSFVRRHRDLVSLWPALKSFSPQWEPRRVEVRRQFEQALNLAEDLQGMGRLQIDSSAWTGATTGIERAKAVRTLLPLAHAAVERFIRDLEAPSHNGGPPLDEVSRALDALRQLHNCLGRLISAANDDKLDQAYHEGLPLEAAKYAKRAAKLLRDDPMPYAVSALVLGVMAACGIPDIGGYLAGVALSVRKSNERE